MEREIAIGEGPHLVCGRREVGVQPDEPRGPELRPVVFDRVKDALDHGRPRQRATLDEAQEHATPPAARARVLVRGREARLARAFDLEEAEQEHGRAIVRPEQTRIFFVDPREDVVAREDGERK